jgi:hypothetical protein
MSGVAVVIIVFLVLAAVLAGAAYYVYQRKLRRAKAIERGLKMVPILIHLPPPSSDTEAGNRDVREVMREKTAQAQVLYNMVAGTATAGFKSRFYGQRHMALEVVAVDGVVHFYAAVPVAFVSTVSKAIQTAYPGARMEQVEDHNIFNQEGRLAATLGGEMVLRQEYVYPIATYDKLERDPMEALLTTVSSLEKKDGVAIQIMLRPASQGWVEKSKKVADAIRKGRAQNVSFSAMDLAKAAVKSPEEWRAAERERLGGAPDVSQLKLQEVEQIEEKTKHPGFEVLIRVLVSTQSVERSQQLLREIATTFALFESPGLNGFKFLPALDVQGLVTAFIFRFFPPELRSNILNSVELSTMFHLPDSQFTPTQNVERQRSKQVDGPVHLPTAGLLFGHNEFRGVSKEVRLAPEDRRRHSYILGQTGTGKSTMLENLAYQDMLTGAGFAFIDPHGDSAEKLLALVPKNRAEDVIYFNPADLDYPLGLNLFEFSDPSQKDFIVQETINMLYKLYDPGKTGIIGPRYEHWYRNAALTLMSDPSGSTFIEIPKVFTDTDYLKMKFKYLRDPTVIDFWTKEMGQTSDYHKSEMLGWFVSKFGAFQNNEMMRNIIGQTKSAFNLREVMDQKKILIVNLSKGRVGELNSQLLGMIFVIKFQAAAMSRANMPEDQRTDFCLYVDEFQNFSTDSFASILSEARKYRLNLIVANQFVGQLSEEIRNAVFGNIGSIVAHRMGPDDAEYMVKQFAPVFDANDLVNIPNFNAAMRLMIGGLPSQPFTLRDSAPLGSPNLELGLAIKQLSAAKYGHARAKVEADIMSRLSVKSSGSAQTAPGGGTLSVSPADSGTAQPASAEPQQQADPGAAPSEPVAQQPVLPPAPAAPPAQPPVPESVSQPVIQSVSVPEAAAPAPPQQPERPMPQPMPQIPAAPPGPKLPQAVINSGMHPGTHINPINPQTSAPLPPAADQMAPAQPGAIYTPAPPAQPDLGPAPVVDAATNDPNMEGGFSDMGAPMGAPSVDPQMPPISAPPLDPQPEAMAQTPPPIGAPPMPITTPPIGAPPVELAPGAPTPQAMPVPAMQYPVTTGSLGPTPIPQSQAQPAFAPAPIQPLDDALGGVAPAPQPVVMPAATYTPPQMMTVPPPTPGVATSMPMAAPVGGPSLQPTSSASGQMAPPPIGAPPVDLPLPQVAPTPQATTAAPTMAPPVLQPPQNIAPPSVPSDPSKTLSLSDITGGQAPRPRIDLSTIPLVPVGSELPVQSTPVMSVTGTPNPPVEPPPPPMPELGSGMALQGDPYASIEVLGDLTPPAPERIQTASPVPAAAPAAALPNDPNAAIPLLADDSQMPPVQQPISQSATAAPPVPPPVAPMPKPEPVAPPTPPVPNPIPSLPPQPTPVSVPMPAPQPVAPPLPPPPAPPVPVAPLPPSPVLAPLPQVSPVTPPQPSPPPISPVLPVTPPPPVVPVARPASIQTDQQVPVKEEMAGEEDFFKSNEPLIHFVDPSAQAVLDRPDVVEPQKAPDEEELLLAGLPEGVTIAKSPTPQQAVAAQPTRVVPLPTAPPAPAPVPPLEPVPQTPPVPLPPAPVPEVSEPSKVEAIPESPAPKEELAQTPATSTPLANTPPLEVLPLTKMAKEPPPIGAAPVDLAPGKQQPVRAPAPEKPKEEPKKEALPVPKMNTSLAEALARSDEEKPSELAPQVDTLKSVSAMVEPPKEPPKPADRPIEKVREKSEEATPVHEPKLESKPAPVVKSVDTVKAPRPQETTTSGAEQIERAEHEIDDLLSESLIHPEASSGGHHRLPEPMVPMGEDDSAIDSEMNSGRRQPREASERPVEHHGLKVIQPIGPIVPPKELIAREIAELNQAEAQQKAIEAAGGEPNEEPSPAVPRPQQVIAPAPKPVPAPPPTPPVAPPPAQVVKHEEQMVATPVAQEAEEFNGLPQAESLAADDVAHARAEREAVVAMQRPQPGQERPVVTEPESRRQEPKAEEALVPKEQTKDHKLHLLRKEKSPEHVASREEEEHNKPTDAQKEQGAMAGKMIMPTGEKLKSEPEMKVEKPKKLAAGEVFVDEHGNVMVGE